MGYEDYKHWMDRGEPDPSKSKENGSRQPELPGIPSSSLPRNHSKVGSSWKVDKKVGKEEERAISMMTCGIIVGIGCFLALITIIILFIRLLGGA